MNTIINNQYPLFSVLENIIERVSDLDVTLFKAGDTLNFTLLSVNLFLLDRWEEMDYIDEKVVVPVGSRDENNVCVRFTETFVTTAQFVHL